MKRTIIGFVAGLLLATASTAAAISTSVINLRNGDRVLYGNVDCSASTMTAKHLTCVATKNTDHAYGVWFSGNNVLVFKGNKPVYSSYGK